MATSSFTNIITLTTRDQLVRLHEILNSTPDIPDECLNVDVHVMTQEERKKLYKKHGIHIE